MIHCTDTDDRDMSGERSFTIRKGVADDAAGIARVHVDAWRSTYRDLAPGEYLRSLSHEKGTEKVKGWFEHPFKGLEVFVAEENPGAIVGFATCGYNRDKRQPGLPPRPGSSASVLSIELSR